MSAMNYAMFASLLRGLLGPFGRHRWGNPAPIAALLIAGVGGAAVVGLAGCDHAGNAPGARTRPPPQVIVQAPQVRDLPIEVRAPVDLRPLLVADVGSKQLGYLSTVLVERGDRVRRGQPVALVRPSDLPDQLRSAQSTLSQAQAALALARSNRARLGELAPSGVVSMQEVEQSRSALSQAEAQEQSAQAQLSAIATRLGETRIDAPIDGVVLSRRLDPGALVGPTAGGGAVLTVGRVDVLKVIVPVRERDAGNLHIGDQATIRVDARPLETFAAQIVRIAPGFDPVTRTLDVELHLPNADGKLRPGMYGIATLRTGLHPQALLVPEAAVGGTAAPTGQSMSPAGMDSDATHPSPQGDRFVYIVEATSNRVRRRPVQLGYDAGAWIEIKKGLQASDLVIVAGGEMVADNVEARPVRNVNPYSGASTGPDAKNDGKGDGKGAEGGSHVAH